MSTQEQYIISPDTPIILDAKPIDRNPLDVWPPERNFNPPTGVDWFQRRLNQIAGFAPNGLSMLRLEWGSTCQWTPTMSYLKYLQRTIEKEQIGWCVDVRDSSGRIIKTLQIPCRKENGKMKATIPDGQEYGIPYPWMVYNQEVGIPRFWISQYLPPEIIGPWDEVRRRIKTNFGDKADIGPYPREGFYFLGLHCIARRVPHLCCEKAKQENRTCFHFYREPGEIDLEYVRALWQRNYNENHTHDWREAPTPEIMAKNLMRIADSKKDIDRKEREEMKLRIKDAFRTTKARYTSRKGKSTFIFSKLGEKETKVY